MDDDDKYAIEPEPHDSLGDTANESDNANAAPASSATNNHNTPKSESDRKGTVRDSYEFIRQNLVQMNRLWVRIKHMSGKFQLATC